MRPYNVPLNGKMLCVSGVAVFFTCQLMKMI